MSNQFKIGDVVCHKAMSASFNITMTVHSFYDFTSPSNQFNANSSDWINCTFYHRIELTFKNFLFHADELEKVQE